MTYNVFGGMLSLTQSINHCPDQLGELKCSRDPLAVVEE